jgi:hypothetical protein
VDGGTPNQTPRTPKTHAKHANEKSVEVAGEHQIKRQKRQRPTPNTPMMKVLA